MSKLLVLLLVIFFVISPKSVAAQSNDVVVRNENDGTTYLTTEVVRTTEDGDTVTTTTTTQTTVAATPSSAPITTTQSPLSSVSIALPPGFAPNFSDLFNGVLSFVLVIAALLVFLFLIWGAFDWITSGGDKGKTDKARQKIIASVIGLIIIASSYAILTLVLRFLGFAGINDVFDSAGTIQGVPPRPTPTPQTLEVLNASPSATPE